MPRRALRRLLPRAPEALKGNVRRLFGRLLHNGNLWHLNRHSVAWGVSVGLFMAFMPVPIQTLLAAGAAIAIGCNLPVAIVTVWLSNPLTVAPLFFSAYKLGAWMLDAPRRTVRFEMSLDWLTTELGAIWEPFLLGCFTLGLVMAMAGHVAVRLVWRIHVLYSWRERRRRRLLRARPGEPAAAPEPEMPLTPPAAPRPRGAARDPCAPRDRRRG